MQQETGNILQNRLPVRHPSHAIEQADHKMPTPMDYVNEIKNIISKRNISNWLIFLATDQDRTIDIFKREFGNKVVFYKTVRRLTDQEDKDFDALPDSSKAVEGFQLQHKFAKNHKNKINSLQETRRTALFILP